MRWFRVMPWLVLLALLAGCTEDEAHRVYREALAGGERGLSREEQLELLNRAIALAPDRLSYRVSRAIAHVDLRAFEMAQRDLDFTLARREHPFELYLRALSRCQRGEFAAALPDFERAIELQPENSQFYRGQALALAELGRSAEALRAAATLLRLAPEHGPSYYARARARQAAGRLTDALVDLDLVIEMRPDLVYPIAARATVRQALGDLDGAARDRTEVARRADAIWARRDPFRY